MDQENHFVAERMMSTVGTPPKIIHLTENLKAEVTAVLTAVLKKFPDLDDVEIPEGKTGRYFALQEVTMQIIRKEFEAEHAKVSRTYLAILLIGILITNDQDSIECRSIPTRISWSVSSRRNSIWHPILFDGCPVAQKRQPDNSRRGWC